MNSQTSEPPENIWLKVIGIPLSAWTLDTFKHIGDSCGGFIELTKTKRIDPTFCRLIFESKIQS